MASLRANPSDQLAHVLRAAELECALADVQGNALQAAAAATDALASAWLKQLPDAAMSELRALAEAPLPEQLRVTRPEGYAFYALQPTSYRALARERLAESDRPIAVIGIRSIGASLSAVAAATVRELGRSVQRVTVRPTGHPWDRQLHLSEGQLAWLAAQGPHAEFWIVDEGPGLSGSTFLAVADALLASGISAQRIVLMCSHEPDLTRLCAPRAAERWQRLLVRSAKPWQAPASTTALSAGAWRPLVYETSADWPACWAQQERLKYLRAEQRELVKFIGLPPYGGPVLRRAQVLAEFGFSPPWLSEADGFASSAWQLGRPARAEQSQAALPRLAEYVAVRARNLSTVEGLDAEALEGMLRVNVKQEFGCELPASLRLEVVSPMETDSRMLPHEWLVPSSGAPWLKLDGVDHADDHLFPGVTDSAWDLAGACVEWQLDEHGRSALLGRYHALTGDDARSRLAAYVLAYAAFRLAYADYARQTSDADEQQRWLAARAHYRNVLAHEIARVPRS